MKNIVITGSSRGIGFGLALEFLKSGHSVTISGRNGKTLAEAEADLTKLSGNSNVGSVVCDVCIEEEIGALWNHASRFGEVDIWINNAGIGQDTLSVSKLKSSVITAILDTNIKGLILCSRYALQMMQEQGKGAIYNMEGFGSDGRKMENMSIYGTTKRAVRYFSKSLALETKKTPILIGSISPGMVVTDLLTNPVSMDSEQNKEAIKIFNILADRTETVCPYLVKEILINKKNGKHIQWLTSYKIMKRFLGNMFIKRKIEGLPQL